MNPGLSLLARHLSSGGWRMASEFLGGRGVREKELGARIQESGGPDRRGVAFRVVARARSAASSCFRPCVWRDATPWGCRPCLLVPYGSSCAVLSGLVFVPGVLFRRPSK